MKLLAENDRNVIRIYFRYGLFRTFFKNLQSRNQEFFQKVFSTQQ